MNGSASEQGGAAGAEAEDDPAASGENAGGSPGDVGDGGAAGAAEFFDPVAASQSDTDALGMDADGNGVRDDLETYLSSLFEDESERVLLVSLAREETKMLLLGADSDSTVPSVRKQALRSMAVHHCVVDALGADRTRLALTDLQSGLLNNELRWRTWLAAEHKLRGSVLPSMACDLGLVRP